MNRSVICVLLGICCLLASSAGGEILMQQAMERPHAGIALAIPKGFELQQLTDPSDILRAILKERGIPVHSVHLSGFVVGPEITAEKFAAERLELLREGLAIRNLAVLRETSMRVAGTIGAAQRVRYTYRGQATEAASVVFIRRDSPSSPGICYLLSVECPSDRVDALLPILGEVVKSVSLIAVRRPAEIKIGDLGPAVTDSQGGYRFAPPVGWFVTRVNGGIVVGQMDYLRNDTEIGAPPLPHMRIIVRDADPGTDGRTCSERFYQEGLAKIKQQSPETEAKLISQAPAKLAALDAHDYVLGLCPVSPPETRPAATQPAGKTPERAEEMLVIAQRTMCAQAGGRPRSYSLVLLCLCPPDRPEIAKNMLEKLSEGFSLPGGPQTRPATRATTVPAATK